MSFDPNAGAPQFGPFPPYDPKPGAGQDQLALILSIISVITGIMGFPSCFCCLFWPLPMVSLATGVPVLFLRTTESTPKTIAIVGVVCAVLSIVAFILYMVLNVGGAMMAPQFRQQFNRP